MPLLFITIACGAISGFHSLASSGTTVKQVDKEADTLFIGYGGMIMESFLAVLVLMAVAGGLGMGLMEGGELLKGQEAFQHHYSSWAAASGLSAKLKAFVAGAANLFFSYGIPPAVGKTIIAVFIVSFANTTLDSATRIQRLSLQEIFKNKKGQTRRPLNNRYIATIFVVLAAALLAFVKPDASGAMLLWPLFGALNQLLAALGLAIVSVWLYHTGKNMLFTFIPMVIILFITLWAMFQNISQFIQREDYVLTGISVLIVCLTAWLLYSSIRSLTVKKR
jgi:carbon starvation protein